MNRTFASSHADGATEVRSAAFPATVFALLFCLTASANAAELRPYSLPSQKLDNPGMYQKQIVRQEKVDESFYKKFASDCKKYDTGRKARTAAMLRSKLKKSGTEAERAHYNRLLNILKGT
jgi:hypothetical protein